MADNLIDRGGEVGADTVPPSEQSSPIARSGGWGNIAFLGAGLALIGTMGGIAIGYGAFHHSGSAKPAEQPAKASDRAVADVMGSALMRFREAGDWKGFFRLAVESRKNILISGATGSGKTSFSKGLIRLIPDYERILTIEDTRELVVPQRNHVHMMYSKDGKGLQKAGAKELLESALRMRPDRILLQELRDGTAFFYLRNVNSGHPGSITTVHANTAEGALEQLTLLVKESEGGNDLDRHDIRALLRSLVDIVVQMHRLPPGDGKPARYRMTEVWFDPAGKPRD
ncbi:ATPase, T2SS/T4P/T4SS family [Sphingomonas sanguinis]|uniref:ATPase, T2SS/T4P/T4SS family n=1 Tax=Sphingomonas sanguinis TaxID=33051 RepID=UPI003017A719